MQFCFHIIRSSGWEVKKKYEQVQERNTIGDIDSEKESSSKKVSAGLTFSEFKSQDTGKRASFSR